MVAKTTALTPSWISEIRFLMDMYQIMERRSSYNKILSLRIWIIVFWSRQDLSVQ